MSPLTVELQVLPRAMSLVCCAASCRGPVTSVEWSPHEAAMLATTSADNSLGIWDLALERDPEVDVNDVTCSHLTSQVQ
jgi:ribosome assembly protein RRB1